MKKNGLAAAIAAMFLVGCGGSGSDSGPTPTPTPSPTPSPAPSPTTAPLETQYLGLWEFSDLAYVAISRENVTTYAFDEVNGCYEAGLFKVDSSTANSLTTTDIVTGEQSTTGFERQGEGLLMQEGAESLTFQPAGLFRPFPGCPGDLGVNTVDIELTMQWLPPEVTVNRSAQNTGYTEFAYEINFDVNKSGNNDVGDVSVTLRHFKKSSQPENQLTSFAEIGADVWTYVPDQGEDRVLITSSDNEYNKVTLEQIDNVLHFRFDVIQNPLFAFVDGTTPVQVATYVGYPAPETDVKEGWQDGPWNWVSERHGDALPDEGFSPIDNHANMTLDDGLGDFVVGESQWADIVSVRFRLN